MCKWKKKYFWTQLCLLLKSVASVHVSPYQRLDTGCSCFFCMKSGFLCLGKMRDSYSLTENIWARNRPKCEKMQLLPCHTTKDEKRINSIQGTQKNSKKSYFRYLRKKMWFSLTKGVLSYIFWRKWSCLNQREQFQWYSCMWWRCSHSYSMY